MRTLATALSYIWAGLAWLLVLPIRGYQKFISPLTPPSCKFYPSCSSYAVTALHRHGPLKGMALSVVRVGRCHPWQAGGLDPVPTRGRWRPDITPDGRTVIPDVDLRSQRTEQLAV